MANKHLIAAFDFDDTIIARDTLPDFLRNSFPLNTFIFRSIKFAPILILFKLGIINNNQAKEKLIRTFFHNMPKAQFKKLCESYKSRLNINTNEAALNRIHWHQERGDEVIIISASLEDWIIPWARENHIDKVIATRLDKRGDKLSGKLASVNCFGPEKVRRFLEIFPDRVSYTLYMYGDGKSDKDMFKLADKVYKGVFE